MVKEQVACVLNSKPEPDNFDKLVQKLSTQTYNELNNQWRLENKQKESRESRLQHAEKLEELVKPEIIELIKRQRINYMMKGTRFIKKEQVNIEREVHELMVF